MNAASLEKRFAAIDGQKMAYVEQGNGAPIVLLHGNPTSSYLWRNIIPHLTDLGRCIAPDLIGMGDSEKLPDSGPGRYRFAEHRSYLDGLIDELAPNEPITLVIHDWGSALGFDWACRHPERVRGIAYMEAIVKPLSWEEWPAPIREIFQAFRSDAGSELILEKNMFIDMILPGAILRDLSAEEMAEYRRPFLQPGEARRPTLAWPNELPIEGVPHDVIEDINAYGTWLSTSEVPKLFINAEPGAILVGQAREFCRNWPNQTEVTVAGSHFIQEDSPDEIGHAVATWLRGIV